MKSRLTLAALLFRFSSWRELEFRLYRACALYVHFAPRLSSRTVTEILHEAARLVWLSSCGALYHVGPHHRRTTVLPWCSRIGSAATHASAHVDDIKGSFSRVERSPLVRTLSALAFLPRLESDGGRLVSHVLLPFRRLKCHYDVLLQVEVLLVDSASLVAHQDASA